MQAGWRSPGPIGLGAQRGLAHGHGLVASTVNFVRAVHRDRALQYYSSSLLIYFICGCADMIDIQFDQCLPNDDSVRITSISRCSL
jgi:hypothetical protein